VSEGAGASTGGGVALEALTLSWNVAGVMVLAVLAMRAHSVALLGFGLDSLIEIGASAVVIWELRGEDPARERRALGVIAVGFVAISLYLAAQSAAVLATRSRPHPSPWGIVWTAATALVMFTLARAKGRLGRRLGRATLIREARVTVIDGFLALAIVVGLALNAGLHWWWADPVSTLTLVVYGLVEARDIANELRART
jgi:divalent metal cation (Fe/Co/Zn/Cd) transporter